MNQYMKVAVLIFRIMGSLMALLGIMGVVYASLGLKNSNMGSGLIYLLTGIIVWLLGKPVGKMVGKDL